MAAKNRTNSKKTSPCAGAQKRVSLLNNINENHTQQNIRYDYNTETDANGQFTFGKFPPGWVEAGYLIEFTNRSWTQTCRTRFEVRSGETVLAKIGGTGRDVTGRFVVPKAYNERVDFDYGVHAFYTPRPAPPYPAGLAKNEQWQWYSQWRTSEDGRRFWESIWHNANVRHYAFRIEKDGTFRIKDVVPGQYEFWMSVEEPATGVIQTSEIASYRGKVVIPGAPNVYIDEEFDLGELTLKMTPPSRDG